MTLSVLPGVTGVRAVAAQSNDRIGGGYHILLLCRHCNRIIEGVDTIVSNCTVCPATVLYIPMPVASNVGQQA